MKAQDFDLAFAMKLRELIKRHGISFDSDQRIDEPISPAHCLRRDGEGAWRQRSWEAALRCRLPLGGSG